MKGNKKPKARYSQSQYGTRVRITLEKAGKKETFVAKPLMAEHVKKAIKDYNKGKIYRREVHAKARAYSEGKQSRTYKNFIKKIGRREKLSKALPFGNMAMSLGSFSTDETRSARPIYEKLAGTLKKSDITDMVIENRSKIDRGLVYTLTPLAKAPQGEARGKIVFRGVSPETAGQYMNSLRFMADNGRLPAYVDSPESVDEVWAGIPKRARVSMKMGQKAPSELNYNLKGFSVSVTFVRPW